MGLSLDHSERRMRSEVVKSNTKTRRRPKRHRQRLKSWPVTFSPFGRARAIARRIRHSTNTPQHSHKPQPSHSSDQDFDVTPLFLTLTCN